MNTSFPVVVHILKDNSWQYYETLADACSAYGVASSRHLNYAFCRAHFTRYFAKYDGLEFYRLQCLTPTEMSYITDYSVDTLTMIDEHFKNKSTNESP